jgi:Beta2-adaptin appendage, C-terminal sub-domain
VELCPTQYVGESDIEYTLAEQFRVFCKASGEVDECLKFYFYAQQLYAVDGDARRLYLVELIIDIGADDRPVTATVRCQDDAPIGQFLVFLESALSSLFSLTDGQ